MIPLITKIFRRRRMKGRRWAPRRACRRLRKTYWIHNWSLRMAKPETVSFPKSSPPDGNIKTFILATLLDSKMQHRPSCHSRSSNSFRPDAEKCSRTALLPNQDNRGLVGSQSGEYRVSPRKYRLQQGMYYPMENLPNGPFVTPRRLRPNAHYHSIRSNRDWL